MICGMEIKRAHFNCVLSSLEISAVFGVRRLTEFAKQRNSASPTQERFFCSRCFDLTSKKGFGDPRKIFLYELEETMTAAREDLELKLTNVL